ncbi:MAG: DUF1499 domain-containing protein [Pseudomonadota bacterium]
MLLNNLLIGVLALLLALALYIRLAPINADRWHKTFYPRDLGVYTQVNGCQVVRKVEDDAVLAQLDAIIRATPRTTVVAGRVEDGMITYMTRSRLWGFPDFITVSVGPDDRFEGYDGLLLKIDGRLRFGRSDLGVNRARIEGWLAQLDAEGGGA